MLRTTDLSLSLSLSLSISHYLSLSLSLAIQVVALHVCMFFMIAAAARVSSTFLGELGSATRLAGRSAPNGWAALHPEIITSGGKDGTAAQNAHAKVIIRNSLFCALRFESQFACLLFAVIVLSVIMFRTCFDMLNSNIFINAIALAIAPRGAETVEDLGLRLWAAAVVTAEVAD